MVRQLRPSIEYRDMAKKLSDVMNVEDLAEYLKLPKTTIYKLAQGGKIPGKKAGRQWRFHKTAIENWLSGHIGDGISNQSRD